MAPRTGRSEPPYTDQMDETENDLMAAAQMRRTEGAETLVVALVGTSPTARIQSQLDSAAGPKASQQNVRKP